MIANPPSKGAVGAVRDTDTQVRPATSDDAMAGASLIHLPMGRVADYLFGFDDPALARSVLMRLFVQRDNRFSHQFADVAETAGEVSGLMLGYPKQVMQRVKFSMFRQLVVIYGWRRMLRFLRRSLPLLRLAEAEPREFYIFTLAVRPEFRRHGIGSHLLRRAETRARLAGMPTCSLGVEVDNASARHLYEGLGYQIVDTVRVPRLEARIGYPGFYRMTKRLAAS